MPQEPNFYQKGFGLKALVADELASDYCSTIVEALRALGSHVDFSAFEVYLAEEFGFCYGVDRAIDYAYETRKQFPNRLIYVTNEIIHNPFVNQRLKELGFRFLDDGYSLSQVTAEDVVLLPAFGATVDLVDRVRAMGCVIVDTTCGSVMNVWKRVKYYGRDGYTSIVHGKYFHEETIATCSHALNSGGHYLVVRDQAEAQQVVDYLHGEGLSREHFLESFTKAISPGFDPDIHLKRMGVANQTTMLASESLFISQMLEDAVRKRDGAELAEENFRRFDTICSATQDRQDAIVQLGDSVELDRILVIGGYNSSNTTHLCKIAQRYAPAYHIAGPEALLSHSEIRHQPPGQRELITDKGWLGDEKLRFGVTSGASTPNSIVAEVLVRLGKIFNVDVLKEILEAVGGEEGLAALKDQKQKEAGDVRGAPLPLHDPNALL